MAHQAELSGNLGGTGEFLRYCYTDDQFLDMSCKWNHTICGLLHIQLLSLV